MYIGCPRSSQSLQPRTIIVFFRSYCQGNKRSEHFETLGLHQDASIKEIKSAFLKLSKELHPDVNPSKSASEEFLKIKTAYDSLVQSSSTSQSTASRTNYSEYYHDTSPDWKRRQGKTRNFDEWLRNLERQNRQRQKTTRSKDGHYEYKSNDDLDEQERIQREINEKAEYTFPGHKSPEYKRYEKSFMSNWDWIFPPNKERERSNLPPHSVYILRQLWKTASVLVVICVIGSGIEIYHEMKLDQPEHADQPRPEYVEAVRKKSGTLDDL